MLSLKYWEKLKTKKIPKGVMYCKYSRKIESEEKQYLHKYLKYINNSNTPSTIYI